MLDELPLIFYLTFCPARESSAFDNLFYDSWSTRMLKRPFKLQARNFCWEPINETNHFPRTPALSFPRTVLYFTIMLPYSSTKALREKNQYESAKFSFNFQLWKISFKISKYKFQSWDWYKINLSIFMRQDCCKMLSLHHDFEWICGRSKFCEKFHFTLTQLLEQKAW